MSLKRYFTSSLDKRPQKKVKELNEPELPILNGELLPLLDLSSPSLSSHTSIVEHFDTIAEHLFQSSYLVCCSTRPDGTPRRELYEFLEFEFYMIKFGCHPDPYTHDEEDQRLSGAWYFHRVPRRGSGPYIPSAAASYRSGSRKGLDLTIGTPNSSSPPSSRPISVRGGILLRSLRRHSDSSVISGPSLLVDELLRASGTSSIPELVSEKWQGDISAFRAPSVESPDSNLVTLFIGNKQTHTSSQMYRSPRIGLDLSHPSTRLDPSNKRVQYVSKPYRYFILPHLLTANGRGQTFLGVHDHCVDVLQISKKPLLASKIASLTGLQPQTVDKYLNAYRDAVASGDLEHFIGARGKGASASPKSFLQLVGALRRLKYAE